MPIHVGAAASRFLAAEEGATAGVGLEPGSSPASQPGVVVAPDLAIPLPGGAPLLARRGKGTLSRRTLTPDGALARLSLPRAHQPEGPSQQGAAEATSAEAKAAEEAKSAEKAKSAVAAEADTGGDAGAVSAKAEVAGAGAGSGGTFWRKEALVDGQQVVFKLVRDKDSSGNHLIALRKRCDGKDNQLLQLAVSRFESESKAEDVAQALGEDAARGVCKADLVTKRNTMYQPPTPAAGETSAPTPMATPTVFSDEKTEYRGVAITCRKNAMWCAGVTKNLCPKLHKSKTTANGHCYCA